MNLKCLFGGHQWNGCKCERCGTTRDERHKWVRLENKCIEKCSICGKERDVEHKWVLLGGKCIEECSICSKQRSIEHKWNNGKCSRCGRIDEKAAVERLLAIFPRYPLDYAGHEAFNKKHEEEIRAIGKALDKQGGMRSMRNVGEDFANKLPIHARKLETMWDGIGNWRG